MLMRRRWWLRWGPAVMVCAFCAAFPLAVWIASQQPQPHDRERPAKTESENSGPGKPRANPVDDKDPGKGKQEGSDHTAEWLIAIFNGLLVYVTYRLVTTTGDLRRSTDKLWEAGEKQIAAAQDAADAAKTSAEAAIKQAEIAERSLTDLERPYVYVFGAFKFDTDSVVVGGFEPFVRYSVANYGRTPAVIEDFLVGMSTTDKGVPDELPLQADTIRWTLRFPVLAPREPRELKETAPEGIQFDHPSENEHCPRCEASEDFFFWVIVRYRGPFSGGYVTSACWRLDDATNRFVQFGGSEYNYEN